jgi:hypothetical protein
MARSAKSTHYPYDPCGGTDPPVSCPATGQCAAGLSFAVGETRVNRTAPDTALTPL